MPTALHRSIAAAGVVAAALSMPGRASAQAAIQMLGMFEQRCGSCHTKPTDGRTPTRETLRQRTPEQVLDALTTGSMKANAEGLTDQQKRLIAEFITDRPLGAAANGAASAMPNHCAAKP